MKTKQEILDEFGRIVTNDVFDNQYRFILNKVSDLEQTEDYKKPF